MQAASGFVDPGLDCCELGGFELAVATALLGDGTADAALDGAGFVEELVAAGWLLPLLTAFAVSTTSTMSSTRQASRTSRRRQYTDGGREPTGRNMS